MLICVFALQIGPCASFSSASASEETIFSDARPQMLSSAQENVRQVLQGKYIGYEELLNFRRTTQNQGYKELPFAFLEYSANKKEWVVTLYIKDFANKVALIEYIANKKEWGTNFTKEGMANEECFLLSLYAVAIFTCSLEQNKSWKGFKNDFSVMALLVESGIMNTIDGADEVSSKQFSGILTRCPVLAPCACKRLPWADKLILMPDPYIIGRFANRVDSLLNSGSLISFHDRTNKCFFSGALSGSNHPYPRDFKTEIPRLHIMDMADEFPNIIECNISGNGNTVLYRALYEDSYDDYDKVSYKYASKVDINNWLARHPHRKVESKDDNYHAQFKYLLSFDGFGAAWSRVPAILATGSVLLMQAPDNTQWFYPWMKAYNPFAGGAVTDQNYITFNKDLSDLVDIYSWLEAHPDQAEKIGQNGRRFAELYLTESNVNQYTKDIFDALYKWRYPTDRAI